MDGDTSAAEREFIAKIESVIARMRAGDAEAAAEAPLGLPAAYWRDVDAAFPLAVARATTIPLLLLQGGRDIQVGDADWQLWQSAFAGQPRASLRH